MRPAAVTKLIPLSADLFVLYFEKISDQWSVGDSLSIGVEGCPEARTYSIYSNPDELDTQIFFRLVPKGRLTPLLANLSPGRLVQVGAVEPGLNLKQSHLGSNPLFVSAGTGLAPFRAFTTAHQNPQITWLHGARVPEDVPAEVRGLGGIFHLVTSRSSEGNSTGRVTDRIRDLDLRQFTRCVICGPSVMVAATIELLAERGYRSDSVDFEVFY